jgi:TRAP-type transport system small permease protein
MMKRILEIGKLLQNFFNRVSFVSGYISGWVIIAMMILVTAAVFARRVIGSPLMFSDEYTAYLMVFCVFMGGAYTLQQDAHVRVDVIAIRLKKRTRIFLQAVTSCFSLVYGVVLMWKTGSLVLYYKQIGQRALSIMETPVWIPAIVIPVGMAILNFQIVLCIVNDIKNLLGGNPVED